MPNPQDAFTYPLPVRARDEAQRILGQIQGVVWLATEELDDWLPEPTTNEPEQTLTASDLHEAVPEVHLHFGKLHSALNTGSYDQALVDAGFAGGQGQAKRKGFWSAIRAYFAGKKEATQESLTRMRSCLRWSATLLGSIAGAVKKEIERVPGAAAAGEAAKEFIELLLNASETADKGQEQKNKTKTPREVTNQ